MNFSGNNSGIEDTLVIDEEGNLVGEASKLGGTRTFRMIGRDYSINEGISDICFRHYGRCLDRCESSSREDPSDPEGLKQCIQSCGELYALCMRNA